MLRVRRGLTFSEISIKWLEGRKGGLMIFLLALVVGLILVGGIFAGLVGIYVIGAFFKGLWDDVWDNLE
jgi:hypothetical protein